MKLYDISINFIVFVLILKLVLYIYEIILVKKLLNEILKSWWCKKLLNEKICCEGDLMIFISIRLVFN